MAFMLDIFILYTVRHRDIQSMQKDKTTKAPTILTIEIQVKYFISFV